MELGPWSAPQGHRVDSFRRLSLDRPRPLPSSAPRGQDARDLRYYDSWVPHPGAVLTPKALLDAFRQAEFGYPQLQADMFEDLIESDGHARNLFEHREGVVAKSPPVVNPGDDTDDGQLAADVLGYALARLALKGAFRELLRVNRHGYAGAELDWGLLDLEGRSWAVPTWITPVPARRFRIGVQGMMPVERYPDGTPTGETEVRFDELRLYQLLEFPQGHPLRPGKWLTLKRQVTQIARGGLCRTAALYMMAKRFSFRDWIILSEKYGIPFPLIKYDHTSDQETIDTARQILERLGSDGGAVVDKTLDIEIKEGVKVKDPMQDRLIAFCNNELSKLVNGSTLRNDNDGAGSYGLGDVHDAVAWDEVRADGDMLSEALTLQVAEPFARYNGLKARPPTVTMMVEPDCGPSEFMSLAVKHVNELGGKASLRQVHQRTGLRMPIDTEDEAPGMKVGSFPSAGGGAP